MGLVFSFGCGAETTDTGGSRRSGGGTDMFGNPSGPSGSGDFGNGPTGPAGMAGTTGGGTGVPLGNGCARVNVNVERLIPRVMLVVDGSGSMNDSFGNGTRWSSLRSALMDPMMGLVPQLESTVEFGLTIYARADVMACPNLVEVPIALNNFAVLDAQYPQRELGGGTPTGEALATVVAKLQDVAMPAPDTEVQPQIMILATDGMPNGCGAPPDMSICPNVPPLIPGFPAGPDPFCVANYFATLPPDYQGTVDGARAAQMKGTDTYVISLAPGQQQQSELQRVANVGLGLDEGASPGAPIFEPTDPNALRDALLRIVGGAVGCQLQLEGSLILARACEGTVEMNGNPLACDGGDGWRALDETHIELTGNACAEFLGNPAASVNASWPCGVVVQ